MKEKIYNYQNANKWIDEFHSHSGPFAVFKISGASLQKYSQIICEDIARLH